MIEKSTVLYYCPCYKSPADLPLLEQSARIDQTNEAVLDDLEAHLPLHDLRIAHALFPLESLYFCYDCHTHRCPRCVIEELVSLYCPNCLFEVPGKINVADRHCSRNCFRCPECQSSLQTVGHEGDGFDLECSYCPWTSKLAALTFIKPSSLASQMHLQKPDQLKARFDQVGKHFIKEKQSQQEDMPALRFYKQYKAAIGQDKDVQKAFKPAMLVPTDANSMLLMPLSTVTEQRAALPLRTSLRSKRTKRCRQCRLLLVKPDPKPLSVHFRSRLYARNVLPKLSFAPCASGIMIAGVTTQWSLKVSNALPVPIDVTLSTQRKTDDGDYIVIVSPEITIGANSEEWEETGPLPTKSISGELLDAGRNWAKVLLQLTPAMSKEQKVDYTTASAVTATVSFAVFVQMRWDDDDERDRHGERTKTGKVKKELGFWTVLDTAFATREATI